MKDVNELKARKAAYLKAAEKEFYRPAAGLLVLKHYVLSMDFFGTLISCHIKGIAPTLLDAFPEFAYFTGQKNPVYSNVDTCMQLLLCAELVNDKIEALTA